MPANIVKGQDAIDVAAYVASVAGQSGYTTAGGFASLGTDGAAIFKGAGCAGCHTLAAAGATGTIGPEPRPAQAEHGGRRAHQVTVGGGVMPAFKGKLTPGADQGRREVRLLLRREVAGLGAADGKRDPLADRLEHPVVAGHEHLVGAEDAQRVLDRERRVVRADLGPRAGQAGLERGRGRLGVVATVVDRTGQRLGRRRRAPARRRAPRRRPARSRVSVPGGATTSTRCVPGGVAET